MISQAKLKYDLAKANGEHWFVHDSSSENSIPSIDVVINHKWYCNVLFGDEVHPLLAIDGAMLSKMISGLG